jgi:hypothetical protein
MPYAYALCQEFPLTDEPIYEPVSFYPTPSKDAPPKRHGGRRPGAGGKPGNLNALKTGLHSPRLYRAALLVAVVPELRLLFEALIREDPAQARRRYRDIFAVANAACPEPVEGLCRRSPTSPIPSKICSSNASARPPLRFPAKHPHRNPFKTVKPSRPLHPHPR